MTEFTQTWSAQILRHRPLIAPAAQYIYPQVLAGDDGARTDAAAEALEVIVKPSSGGSFLATFVRGFADPGLPHGIWACPNRDWLCAAAGGYAYMINTRNPQIWRQIAYRPVLEIRSLVAQNLLPFVGFHALLAWGHDGISWESDKLSDEGLRITEMHQDELHGFGWNMRSDQEVPFAIDLRDGRALTG